MSRLLIALACALSLFTRAAHAEDTYAWTMPPPEQQLAADESVIPIGKGAIFIPSITGPEFEPPATLVSESEIQSVPTGQRFLVAPGPYVVVISSGAPTQGVSIAIDVKDGETTLVPVGWGALRIEVTDERRIPHRGAYEIIRSDTRQPVGTGFGADTLQGEILQTWLLPPGLYRIVRPGRNYRALRDYATVEVHEAGFVRFRLVQDEFTGEFLGSGVLLPSDFATDGQRTSRWFRSLVLGIDGSFVSNQNTGTNQTQFTAGAFVDGQGAFNAGRHRVNVLVQAEASGSQIRPEGSADLNPNTEEVVEALPWVTATDQLRGDVLYSYDVFKTAGPYVRASAESHFLPTDILVSEDTTYEVTKLDGTVESIDKAANETFHTADPWRPTLLREGAGINTRFLQKNRSMNFNFRMGFGLRQHLYDGALVFEDLTAAGVQQYKVQDSFNEIGAESTVVASLRLPGWVVYSTDLELFVPFVDSRPESISGSETGNRWNIAASWRNTVSFRVTRNLSLNYFANIDLEPQISDETQVQQSLLLRASWSLW